MKNVRVSHQFRKLRADYLRECPICEWCNERPSRVLHHRLALSRGGPALDTANFMALCSTCHPDAERSHSLFDEKELLP